MKYLSAKISIKSINCLLPVNLISKLSDFFIGIKPSILIGISDSFIRREKSISKIELLNLINPLLNTILLFFIDELLEEI